MPPVTSIVVGDKVIAYAREFLDQAVPLDAGSHSEAKSYRIADKRLLVTLQDDSVSTLANAGQLRGFLGDASAPSSVLLCNNGLHVGRFGHRHCFVNRGRHRGHGPRLQTGDMKRISQNQNFV